MNKVICFNLSNYDLAREKQCTACNLSKKEIVQTISAALPASQLPSGLIPGFPHFPVSLLSQFPGIRAASSNKKCLLLNFVQSCWPSDPVSLSSHLLLCLHLKLYHPTTFLTSWSVVFLTAVQPLLSDGLFCCLKHLIGGQVYIIRGESLLLLQSEVLSLLKNLFILSSWMYSAKHKTFSISHFDSFITQTTR